MRKKVVHDWATLITAAAKQLADAAKEVIDSKNAQVATETVSTDNSLIGVGARVQDLQTNVDTISGVSENIYCNVSGKKEVPTPPAADSEPQA